MKDRPIEVAPSILSADFGTIDREVRAAQDAGADRIHCDVMDGRFVPNITFGPRLVQAVKRAVTIPLDVHLMIVEPWRYVNDFCDAGADILIVHAEVCPDAPQVLASIAQRKVRPGICVNPDKDISLFLPYIDKVAQVLIMTVNAGFGGQALIPATIPKIAGVREAARKRGLSIDIEVDGGINETTARTCAANGANVLVAGQYVFGSKDYAARIRAVRQGALEGRRASAG